MARESGEWMRTKLAAVYEYLTDVPVSSCGVALATAPVPHSTVSPDHDPNGTNLPYQVSPMIDLCCFGPSQNLEAEVNECRHLSSPVLA